MKSCIIIFVAVFITICKPAFAVDQKIGLHFKCDDTNHFVAKLYVVDEKQGLTPGDVFLEDFSKDMKPLSCRLNPSYSILLQYSKKDKDLELLVNNKIEEKLSTDGLLREKNMDYFVVIGLMTDGKFRISKVSTHDL